MTKIQLPIDCIYNLRTFAFSLANETAFLAQKIDDLTLLFEPSNALGDVFALATFGRYDQTGQGLNQQLSENKPLNIAEYIDRVEKQLPVHELFNGLPTGWQHSQDWRGVVYRFFHDLGNRTLKTDALMSVAEDYGDYLYEASAFELVCATLCNLIRMNNTWQVTNESRVRTRVSELIRSQIDASYQPKPEFEDWETGLFFDA